MENEDAEPAKHLCLLLDGNPADLANLKFAAEYAGLKAITASTEVEALVRLSETSVDLLVLSLDLAGSGGMRFVQRLRRKSALPILALSEQLDRTYIIHALGAGVDDLLAKPFFVDEFSARALALLRRTESSRGEDHGAITSIEGQTAPAPPPVVAISLRDRPLQIRQFGPVKMDPFESCAAINGVVIPLTQGEFILLEALAVKEGAITTRAEIETALYGETDGPRTKVMDVFMNRVKKKLKHALQTDKEIIMNHRGKGWSLRIDELG